MAKSTIDVTITTGSCQQCELPGFSCLVCSILGAKVILCKDHDGIHFRDVHDGEREFGNGLTVIGVQETYPGPRVKRSG